MEALDISHFLLNDFLSDCVLINKTDNSEYNAHKIILSAASRYVYRLLSEGKTTNRDDGKLLLNIPERIKSISNENEIINLILKYIYYNQNIDMIDINYENVFSLLSFSFCLEINSMTRKLCLKIKDEYLKKENCISILIEAIRFSDRDLENESMKLIKSNFTEISMLEEESEKINYIHYQMFLDIVSSHDIKVVSEKIIADMIIKYIIDRRQIEDSIVNTVEENPNKQILILNQTEKINNEEKAIDPEKINNEEKAIEPEKINNEEKAIEPEKPNNEDKPIETEKINNEDNPIEPEKSNHESKLTDPIKSNSDDNNNANSIIINKVSEDKLHNRLKKIKLTNEQERILLEQIRFSFLTHNELLEYSKTEIFCNHQDLILEGLSFRLNSYENSNKTFKININPRIYEIKSKSNLDDSKVFNPISSYENVASQKQENLKQYKFSQSTNNPNLLKPNESLMINNLFKSYQHQPDYNFKYEYDLDENGILFFIGSLGRSTTWRNPHDIGQVRVFASSLGKGNLSDLVGRELVNLRTLNERDSYFGIDLGEDRYLSPTCYTLRNRNTSSHVLISWEFLGSNDKINFQLLDTRSFVSNDLKTNQSMEKERNSLKKPGCTSTWLIDSSISDKFQKGFRYFKIRQKGENSSGAYNLGISGIEIYGKIIGNRWKFN